MTIPDFIPQVGLRFSFKDTNFEVTYVHNNVVRFSAVDGGKTSNIPINSFSERYKTGEIQCTSSPHKLLLNGQLLDKTRRAENYIKVIITTLDDYFSHKKIGAVIPEIAKKIDDPFPPSTSTVIRWIRRYIENDYNLLNIYKVKIGNRFFRFSPEMEQIISNTIEQIIKDKNIALTHKNIQIYIYQKMLEHDIQENPPSRRTIQRRLKQYDPYKLIKATEGTRIANQTLKAAGRKMKSPFILAIVEIDTHILDIIIIDSTTNLPLGRPYLSCAIDVHTRAIVGYYISMLPPSATTTLALLKNMLLRPSQNLPGGIPSLIVPDNGVEFKNTALSHICNHLKITIQPAQNRNPDNKPHIERFFGTLTFGLIQQLQGTTFSNPEARGYYDSRKHASVTLENLKSYVDEWIHNIYHCSIHSMTGRAPMLFWEDASQSCPPLTISTDEVDIIARRPISRKIHKGQVKFEYLTYFSHALATLEANGLTDVIVMIDELNLEHVYIKHSSIDEVIRADSTEPDYTKNLSLQEHLEIRKELKLVSQADKQRLGKHRVWYARWKLYERIQKDACSKNKKLKQLKLELPQTLKNLLDQDIHTVSQPIDPSASTFISSSEMDLLNQSNLDDDFGTLEFDDE
ncbi:Mu transposase C-terminal domain-containing protein [Acinetobacter baumannii]|uniref:Mu transposase C-terminal domain-containing protein n=1 Tax=Acinetobacter baumannii TaxID=470 RepID=UPI00044A0923|nr:Mu transposase C-terminal domain-containing protein [Acinetobacter baumannii]EXR62891.1 integrase core domain protein [Acinetobacter baumannii 1406182]